MEMRRDGDFGGRLMHFGEPVIEAVAIAEAIDPNRSSDTQQLPSGT